VSTQLCLTISGKLNNVFSVSKIIQRHQHLNNLIGSFHILLIFLFRYLHLSF